MTQFFFLTVQGKIKQQVRTDQKHRPAFFLWGLNRAKGKKKKSNSKDADLYRENVCKVKAGKNGTR